MSQDLQSLLEKINRDGIEKARAEADALLGAAREAAAKEIAAAKEEAAKIKARAEEEARLYEARARESLSQAARDTVISVENAVRAVLENLLLGKTKDVLSSGEDAAVVLRRAVKDFAAEGEIASAPAVAEALRREAVRLGSFTVAIDENTRSGFTVKTDSGRVEHSFTGDTLAAELAKRLRPELAKLVSAK